MNLAHDIYINFTSTHNKSILTTQTDISSNEDTNIEGKHLIRSVLLH